MSVRNTQREVDGHGPFSKHPHRLDRLDVRTLRLTTQTQHGRDTGAIDICLQDNSYAWNAKARFTAAVDLPTTHFLEPTAMKYGYAGWG